MHDDEHVRYLFACCDQLRYDGMPQGTRFDGFFENSTNGSWLLALGFWENLAQSAQAQANRVIGKAEPKTMLEVP